ncbi:PREDICTED: neuropilin-2-like [Branchiostoma belcheri]|uniref:Neuropilin-2-like n=1 Tax=Branchiostoma belcheri TaxID=7741 RepID=A0A6P5ANB7_BRABE|nr:PREDICTED: neuropilin-2-like [Branchiostoma belcheri]
MTANSIDVMSSPGYPLKYQPNDDCWFVLTTEPGYGVQMNMLNFDLQDRLPPASSGVSGVCADYVVIHAPLGGQPYPPRCGTSIPAGSKISAPANTTLALRFVTDATDERSGFSAVIQSLPEDLLATTLTFAD